MRDTRPHRGSPCRCLASGRTSIDLLRERLSIALVGVVGMPSSRQSNALADTRSVDASLMQAMTCRRLKRCSAAVALNDHDSVPRCHQTTTAFRLSTG